MSLSSLLSWALFPLYAVEGIRTRLKTPRLRPGTGPYEGRFEGAGAPLRLLVLGDSSVAGVGIGTLENGLSYQLAQSLARQTGRAVEWRAAGFNSATANQLCDVVVPHLPATDYTHIYVSVGFNDLKNFHSGTKWKKGFGELIYALKAKYPGAKIFWSCLMSPHGVPALTPGLAYVLGLRRPMINKIGRTLCEERGGQWVSSMPGIGRVHFCEDGVHASERGNKDWADHVVEEALAPSVLRLEDQNEVHHEQHKMNRAL
ncbi:MULTISPECIES: SGNH/GDSL hydrolase family protein [Pseudovibrio]|uniref:SGNH/GDSL hydrolase family protein n=1 Tax=Stappiaceae TaxID=2821832 RepID=UPI0023651C2C|nr:MULTISPECIES: SGNH/GDSL hydrolase family protein [Pseudovibrio]MDD7911140.1 SGNH/GDSL hydrolase family protein [Pseudovibrio exalbescens]MDX5593172.1 SGNH/GDSL hydrolase family protein [Pseudovibrio sp. SPO723]